MSLPLKTIYDDLMESLGIDGLEIPRTAVTFFREGEGLPDSVKAHQISDLTLTVCQACRQASLGDAVCLTRENIGCVAGAISLGLVAADDSNPLGGARVYTDLMKNRWADQETFVPPSPKDFTDGSVYACRDAGRPEFSLFGPEDSGRFQNIETARKAVKFMVKVQPPTVQAAFLYSAAFTDRQIVPDVVILNVRPVELTRLFQAYQYETGQPITASMAGLRGVCSDLLARPYMSQKINVSAYCLGARLIARYEAHRMGIGIPYVIFSIILEGLRKSKTGYPFHHYPGA
jgi:uncharacterized protein (DUF169 family)